MDFIFYFLPTYTSIVNIVVVLNYLYIEQVHKLMSRKREKYKVDVFVSNLHILAN